MDTIQKIRESKVIAIIRNIKYEDMDFVLKSLRTARITAVEVTMNTERYEDIFALINEKYSEDFVLGAGTVVTTEQVAIAKNCGAKYIISPNVDVNVIKATKEMGLVSIPGALTPSDIMTAVNAGADIVKLFPVDFLGANYVKALKGPINKVEMIAVGIPIDKIAEYKNAGIECYGNGAMILPIELIESHDDKIVDVISSYLSEVKK